MRFAFISTLVWPTLLLMAGPFESPVKAPPVVMASTWVTTEEVENALNSQTMIDQMRTCAKSLKDLDAVSSDPAVRLRFEILLGADGEAMRTLETLTGKTQGQAFRQLHFELFLKASALKKTGMTETQAFGKAFQQTFSGLNDLDAASAGYFSGYNLKMGYAFLRDTFQQIRSSEAFTEQSGIRMITRFVDVWVYSKVLPNTLTLLEKEYHRRFDISDQVLIRTKQGATLSALVVLPKSREGAFPVAMMFNIYADPRANLSEAIAAAAHGYAGVVVDARGKRLSPDPIRPYETEVEDVNAAIDWAASQPWSTGAIGMYGGSYLGFAQWAATKKGHPALKTIVPYVAAIPGLGLPMENNVFLNANYGWAFYVTNNKLLDDSIYSDPQRWSRLNDRYFKQGVAYRAIDQLDGTPNPWLQRWLQHPAYDAYWQGMVPYAEDYRHIDIPILTITGYYDDGQISALHYLDQHDRYKPDANHYLVIGPYDHRSAQGTQSDVLRGYRLDPSAHIDVKALTFAWLDYIMKGGEKPALLRKKINFQIMGGDLWRHLDHWSDLQKGRRRFYFSRAKSDALSSDRLYKLVNHPSEGDGFLSQVVDLTDREQENNDYYPWPIIRSQLEIPNGLAFVSEPFDKETVVQGRFTGEMKVRINKKDFDLGLVFYELTPEGEAFHLSCYLGRASYAKDMGKRELLRPGLMETVPFERTRMTGKLMKKGSRLLVLVNINKNRFAQINYGTGKDVSDETMEDAGEPLRIDWFLNSFIEVALTDWPQASDRRAK